VAAAVCAETRRAPPRITSTQREMETGNKSRGM
jgi:hypothetical protein